MFGCVERRSKNKLVEKTRDRIKKLQETEVRIAEIESIECLLQKAKFECATQSSSTKVQKLSELTQQTETELGKIALTMVRRKALQTLLSLEREQHIKELHRQGLTIYKQRV